MRSTRESLRRYGNASRASRRSPTAPGFRWFRHRAYRARRGMAGLRHRVGDGHRRRPRPRNHRPRRLRRAPLRRRARWPAPDRRRGAFPPATSRSSSRSTPPDPHVQRRVHVPSCDLFRARPAHTLPLAGSRLARPHPRKGTPHYQVFPLQRIPTPLPRLKQRLPARSRAPSHSRNFSTHISLCLCSSSSLEEPRRKTRRAPLPAVLLDNSSPPAVRLRHNERHN